MGYSTFGGRPTRGEAYRQLIDHINEAANQCYMLMHMHKEEFGHSDVKAAQWHAAGNFMLEIKEKLVLIATQGLRK